MRKLAIQRLKNQQADTTFLLDKQGRPVDEQEKLGVIFRCLMSPFFRRLKRNEKPGDFQDVAYITGGEMKRKEIRESMVQSLKRIRRSVRG